MKSYTKEEVERMAKRNPSKRLGTPEDIVNVLRSCSLIKATT